MDFHLWYKGSMEKQICIICKRNPIGNKKRQLCFNCYQKLRKTGKLQGVRPYRSKLAIDQDGLEDTITSRATVEKHEHVGELEFIKNYFRHFNWIPQPASFSLNGHKYTPDFYDGERNVFIEVSRTRQAYSANSRKYKLFRELFPKLRFEIRKPSGELLTEDSREKEWEQ